MTTEQYQGMSRAVVAALMTKLQSYDRKFSFEEADVLAFHDVAVQQRWNAHELDAAVRKWGATNTADEWPTAAKIGALIRTARQDRMAREASPQAQPQVRQAGSSSEHRRDVMAMWADAQREAKAGTARNRALVLKHDDLCVRVKAALGCERADQWGGFVPPATIPSAGEGATGPTTDAGQGFQVNRSPVRTALLEIIAEAERREAS